MYTGIGDRRRHIKIPHRRAMQGLNKAGVRPGRHTCTLRIVEPWGDGWRQDHLLLVLRFRSCRRKHEGGTEGLRAGRKHLHVWGDPQQQ